jgi:cytochrome P450
MVDGLKSRIREIARDLIREAAAKPTWDLIGELAVPLPILVIGSLLGVPEKDNVSLKAWATDIAALLGNPLRPFEIALRAQSSIREIEHYFRRLLTDKKRSPGDDLLSRLSQTGLQEKDILANASLLLFAGHETTTNLIGNGVLGLLRTPDGWEACASWHVNFEYLVEELLRFDCPAQHISRVIGEAMTICDQEVRANERIFCLTGAAHRDPILFPNPDWLDVRRTPVPRHLAFGQGLHFCPGAMLSRVEGQIALEELARSRPFLALDLTYPIRWLKQAGLRGLEALHVCDR